MFSTVGDRRYRVRGSCRRVPEQKPGIAQRPSEGRSVRHFDLHCLTYKDVPTGIEAKAVERPRDIRNLNLRPQRDAPESTEFVSVSDSEQRVVLTTLVRGLPPLSVSGGPILRKRMLIHDKETLEGT